MPRYFFHTECDRRFSDDKGEEHADIDAARTAAGRAIAELLRGGASHFWGSRPWTMTVTDERGLILFTVFIHGQDAAATRDAGAATAA